MVFYESREHIRFKERRGTLWIVVKTQMVLQIN